MIYSDLVFSELDVVVCSAGYPSEKETDELHLILTPGSIYPTFEEQYAHLGLALAKMVTMYSLQHLQVVLKRYLLSDAANQAEQLEKLETAETYALSFIQQPPLNGSKLILWAYLLKGEPVKDRKRTVSLQRNGYTHRWITMLQQTKGNAAEQTWSLFEHYKSRLSHFHENLKDHCVRTWLYVQNVDRNYKAVVKARSSFFELEGMNDQTHYIASTGIEGKGLFPASAIQMDAYSIGGLAKEQVTYLQAKSHLSPTSLYGVTFERGTCIAYGDRRHIFLSGTASIDSRGQILHTGRIDLQMQRTLENMEVLLNEADAGFSDLAQLIVYIRDTADARTVQSYLDQRFPCVPKALVWAPVCRPGWLIEMEAMAITAHSDHRFRPF